MVAIKDLSSSIDKMNNYGLKFATAIPVIGGAAYGYFLFTLFREAISHLPLAIVESNKTAPDFPEKVQVAELKVSLYKNTKDYHIASIIRNILNIATIATLVGLGILSTNPVTVSLLVVSSILTVSFAIASLVLENYQNQSSFIKQSLLA